MSPEGSDMARFRFTIADQDHNNDSHKHLAPLAADMDYGR